MKYQINMLHDNGWDICLEGIDNEKRYEEVKKLGDTSYFQGRYYSGVLTPERIHRYMEEV